MKFCPTQRAPDPVKAGNASRWAFIQIARVCPDPKGFTMKNIVMSIKNACQVHRLSIILCLLLLIGCTPSDNLSGAGGLGGAEVTETALPTPMTTVTPVVLPTTTLVLAKAANDELSGASQGERPAQITFPEQLTIGHSTVITAEIILDPQLASKGTGVIQIETNSTNGIPRISVQRAIPVYQVMRAELTAAGFDISPSTIDPERIISPNIVNVPSLSWTWNVIAHEPQLQTITINFYSVNYIGGQKFSNLVHSESFEIQVQDKPFLKKAEDTLANGWLAIIGTAGPLGLVLGIVAMWQANKEKKEFAKKYEDKYESLRLRIGALEVKTDYDMDASEKHKRKQRS